MGFQLSLSSVKMKMIIAMPLWGTNLHQTRKTKGRKYCSLLRTLSSKWSILCNLGQLQIWNSKLPWYHLSSFPVWHEFRLKSYCSRHKCIKFAVLLIVFINTVCYIDNKLGERKKHSVFFQEGIKNILFQEIIILT